MDAREVAKELKREDWYAWATKYASIVARIERVRAKAGLNSTPFPYRGLRPNFLDKPGSRKAFRQASELLTDFESLAHHVLGIRDFVLPYRQRLTTLV
jgi:hypothetical protein